LKKAFTLIELLIVVAIIAILAAIAVPNFLEAQTRAKASRMKNDMRSLATGLESYRVDTNQYPIGFPGDPLPANIVTDLGGRWGLALLSSPIAYITSPLLKDVFIPDGGSIATGSGGTIANPTEYDRAVQYSLRGENGTQVDAGISGLSNTQKGHWWLLRSYGPDKDADSYSTQIRDNDIVGVVQKVYDPTNGTVSDGNIYRIGGPPLREAGQILARLSSR